MPLIVILPALSIMVAFVSISWSLHRLGLELTHLRSSLRRMEATAVASEEFDREATAVGLRAVHVIADARRRIGRPLPRNEPPVR